jgi:cellulose synthase/poly-beta-1,6-N-acetylglucosamine synthase-like glycosyltransferase
MSTTNKILMIDKIFKPTLDWIRDDFKSNRIRFAVELVAWAISIGCSITMAVTVPTPPLIILYPIWITGCAIYAWCAYSRRSFGMLANYILLTTIDTIGLIRMIVQ